MPYFSVITPSFNQGEWIEGCIRSVLAQGTDDFEHIVYDNCSTDQTLEILRRYPHIRFVSEPDRGQAHALNKALAAATGEIICWLNADDQYPPGTFEKVRREFARPEVDVIYGDAQEIFFDGRPPSVHHARFHGPEDFLFWWEKRHDLLQPAVFFRRGAAVKAGPLREEFYIIMDTEFWHRLSQLCQFHYVPEVLAIQQRQPDSKTVRTAYRTYLEKQAYFEPLLHQRYPGKRWLHILKRRRRMAWRWLALARTVSHDREQARQFLRRSLLENPLMLLSPTWWRTRRHAPARGAEAHTKQPSSAA
jgi:glycosyltransferase involved in cell wall biosynthesis